MKNNKKIIKAVLAYIGNYKILLFVSLVMAMITVVLTLYLPILFGDAIDLIVGRGQTKFDRIFKIIITAAIVAGTTSLFQWIMTTINNKIAYNVVRDIRNDAFKRIERLPLSYLDSHSTGDIVSRVIADADQFSDGLLLGFTQSFTGIATILGTLIFMLRIDIFTALIVMVLTPLSLLVARFISKHTYSFFKLQSETRAEQTSLINEMIGGMEVVKAYGREEKVVEAFDEINEKIEKASLKAIFFSSITNPATRFVNNIVYALVGLVGAFQVVNGGISVGGLSAFLAYANQYTKPFNEISGIITELQNAIACAGRLLELINEDVETEDGKAALGADQLNETDKKITNEELNSIDLRHFAKFFESNLYKRMRQAFINGKLYREAPFVIGIDREINTEKETVLVQGIIDAWFTEDEDVILMDYKTDRVYGKQGEEELVRRYKLQLDNYAEALRRITGKIPKEKLIYSFALGKEILIED